MGNGGSKMRKTMFDAEASISYIPRDARASDAYAFFAVFVGFDA